MTLNLTEEEAKEIIDFYLEPNSLRDTVKYFDLPNRYQLHKILDKHNIPQHSKEVEKKIQRKNIEDTCMKRYGVKCNWGSKDPKLNGKATMLEKYGVEHPYENAELLQKMQQTKLERYNDPNYNNTEKAQQTNLDLYGGTGFASPELNEKGKQTTEELYGDRNYNNREGAKQTCLETYGVEFYAQSDECKAKIVTTNLERHGVEHYNNSEKGYQTRKLNSTYNTSQPEENFFETLKTIFIAEDICRQYKEERYPFACDFYIKSLDLFIELNFMWTHGFKKYEGTTEDNEMLESWKQKAVTSEFYRGAIHVWTESDPLKFKTAEENHLNYLAFYTEEEATAWLESQKSN